jgi:hypothetical protein
MKGALIACLSLVAAVSASSNTLAANTFTLEQEVSYGSAMALGLLTGYEKGMYKLTTYKPNDRCLDSEFQKLVVDTFGSWGTPAFSWTNSASNIQKAILLVSNWCDYDEALYTWMYFCYYSEQCMVTYMSQSLMKKVFQVTTVANDLAQLYMDGIPTPKDTPTVVKTFADRFGSNIGKLIRYATDYDPTLYPPK